MYGAQRREGAMTNPRLVALRLVLKELGIPQEPTDLAARKRIQKAVYLAQSAGVPLGYDFGWYKRGPYSPSLARSYFSYGGLSNSTGQYTLDPRVVAAL